MGKNLPGIEIEEEHDNKNKAKITLKNKAFKKIAKSKQRSEAEQKDLERKKHMQKMQSQKQKVSFTENKAEIFREIMKSESDINTNINASNDDSKQQTKIKSRGQKKREMKKMRLLKYKSLENRLAKLKAEKKGGALGGFDSLKRDLDQIEKMKNKDILKEKANKNKKTSRKNIEKKNNEDIERMKTILKFPAFLNNPLMTIKQHIVNTIEQKKQTSKGNAVKKI